MNVAALILATRFDAPTSPESFTHSYGLSRGSGTITLVNSNPLPMTVTLGAWTTGQPNPPGIAGSWVTSSPVTVPANSSASVTFSIAGTTGVATSPRHLETTTITGAMNWVCGGESGTVSAVAQYQYWETDL